MDERTKGRARVVALREFFAEPPPRNVEHAKPEVQRFFNEYMRSAPLARRIVEGIIVVPALIFVVVQWVQVARGKAWPADVLGITLGCALGLGLFVILPSRLFFRAMQRRNGRRMESFAAGRFFITPPASARPGMSGTGDGVQRPVWDTWLALPDGGTRPYAYVALPRADDLPEPRELEVVLGPTGDVLVLWEPGGIYAIVPAETRRRSMPSAPAR